MIKYESKIRVRRRRRRGGQQGGGGGNHPLAGISNKWIIDATRETGFNDQDDLVSVANQGGAGIGFVGIDNGTMPRWDADDGGIPVYDFYNAGSGLEYSAPSMIPYPEPEPNNTFLVFAAKTIRAGRLYFHMGTANTPNFRVWVHSAGNNAQFMATQTNQFYIADNTDRLDDGAWHVMGLLLWRVGTADGMDSYVDSESITTSGGLSENWFPKTFARGTIGRSEDYTGLSGFQGQMAFAGCFLGTDGAERTQALQYAADLVGVTLAT